MDNFLFWQSWNKQYKTVFYLTAILLLFSTSFLVYTSLFGIDFIQGWGSIQDLTTVPIEFQKFTDHYHEFKIETINYLIYEKYTATIIELNHSLALIYTTIIFIGFTLFITFSTTLSKYLYYFSLLLSMLFLATLNLDLLDIFHGTSKIILTATILIYAGLSYAIYNFLYNLNILKRLGLFSLTTALLVLFIYNLSPLEAHVINYHIAGYAGASLIILTGLFVLYVGIEISLTLLYLNCNNKRGSLTTYIFLNLLYLTIFIVKIFYKVDIYGINEFTLIISATVLTIWGTLKRNEDNQLGDTFARVLIIMTLGSLVLATVGFHTANQNSSLMLAFKKEVFVSFLGFGFIFFLYAMVNFIGQIQAKLNAYKIVFQPLEFSTFKMYMLGLIACLALFAYRHNKRPYFQAISGYYNGVADSYYVKGDMLRSEPFFQIAKRYDSFNNRSNVALANVAILQEDLSKAIELYKYAIAGGGNEQAYIQLANIYQQRGDYFDALFTLKEGIKIFPKSSKIWNNLGLLSKKSSLSDSTVYYFSKSIDYAKSDDYAPVNNLITFLIKKDFLEEGKDLIESIDADKQDLKTKAAIAAYNAKNGVFNQWSKQSFSVDSTLTNEELAFTYNHFINNLSLMDTNDLNALNKTLDAPDNIFNYEPITTLKAFYEFYNGDPVSAKDHMATLGSGTSFYSGYFNNLLGLWMLMHKNYNVANKYFAVSDQYNFQGGKFNHAFTESILGNKTTADSLWENLGKAGKPYLKASNSNSPLDSLTDFEKLMAISMFNRPATENLISSISDNRIKNLALIEQAKKSIENNKLEKVSQLIQLLENSSDVNLENQVQLIKAELLLKRGKHNEAANIINTINAPIEMQSNTIYLKAQLAERLNDTSTVNKLYDILTFKYPYFESGIIAYSKYLSQKGNNIKAYNIAVQGVKDIPQSIELRKIYTLLSIELSLTSYAEESLTDLQNVLPKEEFLNFKTDYDLKMREFEEKFNSWE